MTDLNPYLLHAAILAPLLAAVILLLGGRALSAKVVKGVALVGFAAPAVISVWLWIHYAVEGDSGYAYMTSLATGLQHWGIHLTLGLNGISLPLFVLAGVVGLAAGLYAMQSGAERLQQYLMLLLVMLGGLMGVFASIDIFFFYFFHELALIPTFIMIGIWGGRDRQYAAMKMTIYLTLGALLSLAGLIALYVQSGAESFSLLDLREALAGQPLPVVVQNYTFALLMFGFGILVSLWPFHTWAPLGYGAAPTAAAMLHAGVLKKFGIYGLVQIGAPLLPEGAANWAVILAWLALGNVIIIGFVTIAQRDLKQMIGFSSVMHMGYCFLGLACLSTIGAGGAVLLMFAHGVTVALLFLLSSCIYERTRTFDMGNMGGLAQRTPLLAAFFAVAMLASIGLPGPGLANFWGELTVFIALWDFRAWMVVPAVFGVVISAVYGLRSLANIFFGEPTDALAQSVDLPLVKDLHWREKTPAFLLLVVLIFVGVWPRSISDPLDRSLTDIYPEVERRVEEAAPAVFRDR
jgi:NADH-quinone oxidoreductase subunit M